MLEPSQSCGVGRGLLEIAHDVDLSVLARGTLQEVGGRVAGDDQEGVVGECARFDLIDQCLHVVAHAVRQFLRQQLMLVEGLPLQLMIGLIDQDARGNSQRQKKQKQPESQPFAVQPFDRTFHHLNWSAADSRRRGR